MEKERYIEALQHDWPDSQSNSETSAATLHLADMAVQEHPTSAELWIMRGNLLELASAECCAPLKEPLRCYRTAVKIDPFNIEAHEDIAWFLDAVLENRRKAKRFFDKARRLRRSARQVRPAPIPL